MKIIGITKKQFNDNSTAYYMSYQINDNCFVIRKCLTGWYSVFTSRYGYLKADTLAGIKKMVNHAAKAPQY